MSQTPAGGLHNWPNADSQGNELNLRAIGTLRTLILLDGVRMPPTTYFGNVDVDVIPNLLLQRVEIVTGGASAAYGSDAGDNHNNRMALGGGFKFADDRGHARFSFEEYKNDGMLRSDRPAGAQGWIYAGSNTHCTGTAATCTPGGPSNPFTLVPEGRLTSGSNLGLIASGPAGFPYLHNVFLPNGPLADETADPTSHAAAIRAGGQIARHTSWRAADTRQQTSAPPEWRPGTSIVNSAMPSVTSNRSAVKAWGSIMTLYWAAAADSRALWRI
jgi:hypothetical protein